MRPCLGVACAAAMTVLVAASSAGAQQYQIGGTMEIASGLEGGASGGGLALGRARTRIRLGADLRVDEFPKDMFAAAMLVEVEPHPAFGLDLRYVRSITPKLDVNVGALGFVFPSSIVGPLAGARYHLSLSRKLELLVGPEIDVFVIGTDLPSNSVVWQALLQVGVRVDL